MGLRKLSNNIKTMRSTEKMKNFLCFRLTNFGFFFVCLFAGRWSPRVRRIFFYLNSPSSFSCIVERFFIKLLIFKRFKREEKKNKFAWNSYNHELLSLKKKASQRLTMRQMAKNVKVFVLFSRFHFSHLNWAMTKSFSFSFSTERKFKLS